MNSRLKSECGRTILEVEYDAEVLNWDEAIEAAYRLHGLRPGQVGVIATPAKYPKYRQEAFQTPSRHARSNENAEGIHAGTPPAIRAKMALKRRMGGKLSGKKQKLQPTIGQQMSLNCLRNNNNATLKAANRIPAT